MTRLRDVTRPAVLHAVLWTLFVSSTASFAPANAASPRALEPAARAPSPILAAGDHWIALSPPARTYPAVIYDPVRRRLIACAGYRGGISPYSTEIKDLRAFDPATLSWSLLSDDLPKRQGAAAIYDPVRDRVIVFGGNSTQVIDGPATYRCSSGRDVWAKSLNSSAGWTNITPGGVQPNARTRAGAAYDPVRDRLLVVAGQDQTGSDFVDCSHPLLLNDAWALTLSGVPVWSALPTPPSNVQGPDVSAMYDVVGDRLLVVVAPNVFELPLAGGAWSTVPTTGNVPTTAGAAVLDPAAHRILYRSGTDAWSLDLGTRVWTKLTVSGLPAVAGAGIAFDPDANRILQFGGTVDVWSLALTGAPTSQRLPSVPAHVYGAAAIVDRARDRMVFSCVGAAFDETWTLSLADGNWRRVPTTGPSPSSRAFSSAVYDRINDRLVLFGGGSSSDGDVYMLSFSGTPTWTRLAAPGPGPRAGAGAVYDEPGQRLVLFAGEGPMGLLNDTWQLSLLPGLESWSLLPATNPPPPRALAAAALDTKRRRLVVQGGTAMGADLWDTWILPLTGSPTWSEFPADPYGESYHGMIYDPVQDELLTWGGWNHYQAYVLLMPSGPGWGLDCCSYDDDVVETRAATVAFDEARGRVIVAGGQTARSIEPREVWAYGLDRPVAVQMALLEARDADGRAMLRWYVFGAEGPVSIERRVANEPWTVLTTRTPSSAGVVTFEDADVEPGHAYDYRLAVRRADGVDYSNPVRIEIGRAIALAWGGAHPNPARGVAPMVRFALASGAPARLEVVDLAGRRVLAREVGTLGSGWHELKLEPQRGLAAGIYAVRLQQEGHSVTGRIVVVP